MTLALHTLSSVIPAWSPLLAAALISSLWQGLLLTAGVGLVFRFVGQVSPAVRASLWTAVLLLLLALPVLAFAANRAGTMAAHAGVHVAPAWSEALLLLWLVLFTSRACQLAFQGYKLRRLAQCAVPVPVSEPLAGLLNGARRAVLCLSSEVNRPSVAGFFHPRILLPAGLLQTLSPAELEHVVLHEMEHLRRGDDWLNLLQQISLAVLPLQPALLWVDRQLCRERELACDDSVLATTRAPKAYAGCLVKLAEDSMLRQGLTLALSALGTRARESDIVGRVRRILSAPQRSLGTGRTRLAIGSVALMTAFSGAVLLRSPEWIHFDGAASQRFSEAKVSLSSAAGPSSVLSLPVMDQQQSGIAVPVLARAVMDTGTDAHPALASMVVSRTRVGATPRRKLGVPARTLPHGIRALRPLQVKASVEQAPATAWRQVSSPQRSVQGGSSTRGRLVLTDLQLSQPVYAAIATSDGWLILQL